MKIRNKLLAGFLSILILFGSFGTYAYIDIWQVIDKETQELDRLFQFTARRTLQDLRYTLGMVLSLETTQTELHRYLQGDGDAVSAVQANLREFEQTYTMLRSELEAEVSTWQSLENRSIEEELTADIALLDGISKDHLGIKADVDRFIRLVEADNVGEANTLLNTELEQKFVNIDQDLRLFETAIGEHANSTATFFDTSIKTLENQIRRVENTVLIVLLVSLVLVFILSYYLAREISGPIFRLANAATHVEAEKEVGEELADVTGRRDEFGQFARVFDHMAKEVYKRTQQLRAKVVELRIEIDHAKQAQEVQEITDSDYFQELQSRAKELRKRG